MIIYLLINALIDKKHLVNKYVFHYKYLKVQGLLSIFAPINLCTINFVAKFYYENSFPKNCILRSQ